MITLIWVKGATQELVNLREAAMDGFVARQNVEHYRDLLKITTDPERRRQIEKLLGEQEAKLAKYEEDHKGEQRQPPTQRRG